MDSWNLTELLSDIVKTIKIRLSSCSVRYLSNKKGPFRGAKAIDEILS